VDLTPGMPEKTGNALDVAINETDLRGGHG
jgi:flagellar basal body rod protein FlgF